MSPTWTRAIRAAADPGRARHFLEQLLPTAAGPALEQAGAVQARILAALWSGSQALGELLVSRPDWIEVCLDAEGLKHARRAQGMQREVLGWLKPLLESQQFGTAFQRIRQFKQREMLRIATRDLARLSDATEITMEISNVADLCVGAVYQVCRTQLGLRLGQPYHLDAEQRWQPTTFCVLGMGKLGGQELNYSSDIDLMFVYAEEGAVFKTPPKGAAHPGQAHASHVFFQRLVEAIVAELSRLTEDGSLFRVDLRLRPEGNRGPLARSMSGYENYYAQWGQTWERMMLIKTRGVAGDPALAFEFLEMIQPFRYPRSVPERALVEVGEMKARIESEVVRSGELERNVKLGRGGIREIEFIVQTLQLLNAGRLPFLQNAQTLPTLDQLVRYHLLSARESRTLHEAYCFLRDVEHRLQMDHNRQTHTLPTDRTALDRLARLLGFARYPQFERALKRHTEAVRAQYLSRVGTSAPAPSLPLPHGFGETDEQWKELLARHSFRQVDKSLGVLKLFVAGPGYVHISPRTTELAEELILRLLRLCPRHTPDGGIHFPEPALSDPDRVLARLDTFINAYGARATLYESWTSNPSFFDLLVLLFDRSEFLAETAIRTPDLVEDLALSGQLRRKKTSGQILEDLEHGREDADQRLWLRRYHQAELMRLGLRDILGLADFEQNLLELSGLADACLQYALAVVLRRHQLKRPPLAIIGLGKLGGSELTYGSDLDLTFVASARARNLPLLQRIAAEVMELLSSPTEFGVAYVTDARLRPDGEKGLLVNTVAAYEAYYTRRAMLWELQALSRARPIAGDAATGDALRRLATRLTDFSQPSPPVAGYTPDWKQDIARMRVRIEKERTPPGKNALAIKTGTGGLVDAEFIAQTLCLAHGWPVPNTLQALEQAKSAGALPEPDASRLIDHYRKLRRVEGILRRWSYVGETVLPDDPAPLYRVAVRCGFRDPEAFLRAVGEYRAGIRETYQRVFAPKPIPG